MKRLLLAVTMLVSPLAATPAAALTFSYTGNIVSWTVPDSGTYEIIAVGAQGGAGTIGQSFAGGLGALIGGYFELSSGMTLSIAVGGIGGSGTGSGGGGGGSFVVGPLNAPIVIAGGGGGIRAEAGQNGWNANTGQAGLSGSGASPTGGGVITATIGLGGSAGTPIWGSSGGGFGSNGANDGSLGTGGASWANGLAGGLNIGCPDFPGGGGGFGGGGAGAGCNGGGGGGGGYSGGQGGWIAGGGGSFNADTLTGWAQASMGTGNGLVTINLVEEVATPEPASATIALLGLFGLAALRRRR
jgi:MYXO-CTERM domain-containing protein